MPSSWFTDGTSPANDGGERLDGVKVDIWDDELLEFKFHLATPIFSTSSNFSRNSTKTLPILRSSAISQRVTRLCKWTMIENSRTIKLHTCVLQMHAVSKVLFLPGSSIQALNSLLSHAIPMTLVGQESSCVKMNAETTPLSIRRHVTRLFKHSSLKSLREI